MGQVGVISPEGRLWWTPSPPSACENQAAVYIRGFPGGGKTAAPAAGGRRVPYDSRQHYRSKQKMGAGALRCGDAEVVQYQGRGDEDAKDHCDRDHGVLVTPTFVLTGANATRAHSHVRGLSRLADIPSAPVRRRRRSWSSNGFLPDPALRWNPAPGQVRDVRHRHPPAQSVQAAVSHRSCTGCAVRNSDSWLRPTLPSGLPANPESPGFRSLRAEMADNAPSAELARAARHGDCDPTVTRTFRLAGRPDRVPARVSGPSFVGTSRGRFRKTVLDCQDTHVAAIRSHCPGTGAGQAALRPAL
jgi:hypothetical protein